MQNVIIILTLKSTVPVCDTADAVGCVQNITEPGMLLFLPLTYNIPLILCTFCRTDIMNDHRSVYGRLRRFPSCFANNQMTRIL